MKTGRVILRGVMMRPVIGCNGVRNNSVGAELFADTEFFLSDDGAVAVDVFAHEVVKEATTLTYEHLQSALSCMIFVI